MHSKYSLRHTGNPSPFDVGTEGDFTPPFLKGDRGGFLALNEVYFLFFFFSTTQ